MKKSISIILALLMVMGVFAVLPVSVFAENWGDIAFVVDVTSPESTGTVTNVLFEYTTAHKEEFRGNPLYTYQWLNEAGEVVADNQSLPTDNPSVLEGKRFTLKVSINAETCQYSYDSDSRWYTVNFDQVNHSTSNLSGFSTDHMGKNVFKQSSWGYRKDTKTVEMSYTFEPVVFPFDNHVDISITEPVIGEKPSFSPSVPRGVELTHTQCEWYNYDDQVFLTSGSPFKEGYTYLCTVYLELVTDYNRYWNYWQDNPYFTINGKEAEALRGTSDHYTVSYKFPPVGKITGTAEECNWEYDSVSGTFTVSGSGSFDYDDDANDYLYKAKNFVVENGVSALGETILLNSDKIETVNIAGSVKSIGADCFQNCEKLRSVTLGEGIETIGSGSFSEIPLVNSIKIPASVKTIEDGAFLSNSDNFKLIGKAGSAAQTYAEENGIKFEVSTSDTPDTPDTPKTPTSKNISSCTVSGIKAKTYNGKSQTQSVTVKDGTKTLKSGTDYTVSYKNNKNVGTATVIITGIGSYEGSVDKTFKINKAANPMTVKAKKTVSAKAKAKTTIKGAVTVSKAQGSVSYKTNNKKVTIKKGTMAVAKGLKKGKTYKVKITVTAKGNNNYKSQKVVKTIKIKVK